MAAAKQICAQCGGKMLYEVRQQERKVACLGYGGGRLLDEIRGRRGRQFEKYYTQQQYALYAEWRASGAHAELRNL